MRERGQVKHSRQARRVILRVRAQQRIRDWGCTKERYSARGGIFFVGALLQWKTSTVNKMGWQTERSKHTHAETRPETRPGRDFHASLRMNHECKLSPFTDCQ